MQTSEETIVKIRASVCELHDEIMYLPDSRQRNEMLALLIEVDKENDELALLLAD